MSHHDHPSHETPQAKEHGQAKPADSTRERDEVEQERAAADREAHSTAQ